MLPAVKKRFELKDGMKKAPAVQILLCRDFRLIIMLWLYIKVLSESVQERVLLRPY